MDAVNEAMKALKQVALKGKKDKGLAERVDSLTTTLRLLDTSLSADSQIFGKLIVAVREPLVPLYEKFPLQAFQLAAAIFSFLFHEKIVMQLTAGNKVLQSSWEGVAESLLSGVLDFLEMRSDNATLRTLASALYPALCRICFSTAFCSSITMGSALRYTAFTLLVDSANEPTNKEMLRDPGYLGSRRLGATLYGSKDYVILENLFLLVLLVAPKFEFMDKRRNFMHEVFVLNNPEDTVCGKSLARILTKPTERDSDLLQAQVIEVLARSHLMFPQPFDVSHIDSCGLRFPQQPPQQRLIVDYKSLLANVIKDEGYESFRAPFDQICGVTFSATDKQSHIRVVVRTSSAPTIQSRPLKVPDGQSPSVAFEIKECDVLRLKRALRARGIAGPPHISVSQGGPRLEFDREGNAVPDSLASVRKVQEIERGMQLSRRSDDSPEEADNRNGEGCLLIDESPQSPLVHPALTAGDIPGETVASSSSVPAPLRIFDDLQVSHNARKVSTTVTTHLDTKPADVTPSPRAPRQPSVFVPATPSQVKHKDIFGSGDTDLSDPSDDSEEDSMKALSQKLAARADSLVDVTKRASILADAVPSAGASGKNAAGRRVLDSGDEKVLSSSRKGAKGGSKPGANNAKKTFAISVVSDEDDLPPPPAPLKKRSKANMKNAQKPPVTGGNTRKRKRVGSNDNSEVVAGSGVQEKPPPVKRARKTAGRKLATTGPDTVSPAPALAPTPPRDSQVLKKARPAARKNANYGGRAKDTRTSSPARDSAGSSDENDFPDALDLDAGPSELPVEPSPMDDDNDDDDYAPSPTPKPRPKPKSKAAPKPKSTLADKLVPAEKSKTTAVKAKAKPQAGTRTRFTVAKAQGVDDSRIVKVDAPQKTKAMMKMKPEIVSVDEGKEQKGEGVSTKVELAEKSPVVIEVTSSPPEPSKLKLKSVSRVISQEKRVQGSQKTDSRTRARPAPKKVPIPQNEGDFRGEEVNLEAVEAVTTPTPSPKGFSTKKRTKTSAAPISEQAVAGGVEREQDDGTSESTERLPALELDTANDSHFAEANPRIVAPDDIDHEVEVEKGAVVGTCSPHGIDLKPERFDPFVTNSPMKTQAGGITKASSLRVRELVDSDDTRPLEINPDDGGSPEGRFHSFVLPQPIMDRMPVDISTPKEWLRNCADMDVIAQSTPTGLPRGPPRLAQMASRKPRVTFATTPFTEKEAARLVQDRVTPGSGAQRRTIFEDDMLGTSSARRQAPAKGSDKHSALIGVLNEIQDVIFKQVTHQFEVAEEEARFARNDVHNEALTDFKKMHSQRAIQFNALVDLETAYGTRERELVAGYEATLVANTEILGHVRRMIREHDEGSLVGKFPRTLGKSPVSALMASYLK